MSRLSISWTCSDASTARRSRPSTPWTCSGKRCSPITSRGWSRKQRSRVARAAWRSLRSTWRSSSNAELCAAARPCRGSYRSYLTSRERRTKELKHRLSRDLRQVEGGEVVRVTDRCTVVAELRAVEPVVTDEQAAALAELELGGLVTIENMPFAEFLGIRLLKGTRASRAVLGSRVIHYLDTSALVKRYGQG